MRDQEAIARAEQLDGRYCLVSNDHHVNEPAVRPTQRVSGATTVGGTASSERFGARGFRSYDPFVRHASTARRFEDAG
jgi:hypothetical protein